MNKNYYEIYKSSVFNLAETLVIKSEDTASIINSVIIAMYGSSAVNPDDKTTWKYYKNICGEYHPTDTEITVVSLDTLQTITFTSDNLLTHTTTREAYSYGSRNYNELVSLYPDMEMLILGVLYPANMDTAIAAQDGTILSYPKHLVESNEVNLITKLNNWIKAFNIRWFNPQFTLSDSMYSVTHLGLVYLNLVSAIINIRLAACKTNEAHSFHIRQYLNSHGILDFYIDNLTKKQALFFYRNIAYIERNSGKRHIFQWLVEHIMSERNLPIAELVMKHDVVGMPTSLYPTIEFKRKNLNNSANASDKQNYTLQELFAREKPLTNGNTEYIAEHKFAIQSKLANSLSSVVATKALESSVIDYTDSTPLTFFETAVNHWLYFVSNGYYSTFINFKNPASGELVALHCKDAFIYFTYVMIKALGGHPLTIPSFVARRVINQPITTIDEIMSVGDWSYVSRSEAQEILDYQPIVHRSISVDAFNSQCVDLFNANQNQLAFVASQQHQYKRGIIANMVNRTYSDRVISLEPADTEFGTWLKNKFLPTEDFTQDQYLDIYTQLYEHATGATLDSSGNTRLLQKAMVNLLQSLSSYSVQFITEVNSSNLRPLGWAAIRLGDKSIRVHASDRIHDAGAEIEGFNIHSNSSTNIDSNSPYINLGITSPGRYNNIFEINVKPKLLNIVNTHHVDVGVFSFTASLVNNPLNTQNPNKYIGYDEFLALGITDNTLVKDIYCDCFESSPIGSDISGVILNSILSSFSGLPLVSKTISGFTPHGLTNAEVGLSNVSTGGSLNGFTFS